MSKKPQKKSPKSAGGRGRYTPEFRQETLLLAVRAGAAEAACGNTFKEIHCMR